MMDAKIIAELMQITPEERQLLDGSDEINRSIYMERSGNVVSSRKLLSQGKLITVRPHTRFVHFPKHTHDYIEVIYMCRGKTTHIISGNTVELKEGELLFLSQNAVQEILPAGELDLALNFIILPEFFDRTIIMLENEDSPLKRFITDCLLNKSSETAFLHFEVSDVLPIQNLVENLAWSLLNKVSNRRVINQTTMGLIIMQLLSHTDRLAYHNKEEELILNTLNYIEENYVSGSLNQLADLMHYDSAWLSREIKRRTGKTYTELLQEKRLSQATYLLKSTDINIDQIALQVGYNNISYFHRLFYKHFAKTPRDFRIQSTI